MKKVSIIVPVHNSEMYLEQCIESILSQTYMYFELILIDDNSTDSSADILEKYRAIDDRIILKHVYAGTPGKARNYGLKEASGFYLSFIDSDDWIEPTYLEELIFEIESNNCDCAICGIKRQYKSGVEIIKPLQVNGNIASGEAMRNGTLACIMPNASRVKQPPTFYLWDKVYKRSLWENVTFDQYLRNGEDRVALYTVFNDSVRTAITEAPLYNYRVGIGISTQTLKLAGHDDYDAGCKILEIAKENRYDLSPVYQTMVSHSLGRAKKLIIQGEKEQYYQAASEFKKIYPACRSVIHRAQFQYRILAIGFRYFPRCIYLGYTLLLKSKAMLHRGK